MTSVDQSVAVVADQFAELAAQMGTTPDVLLLAALAETWGREAAETEIPAPPPVNVRPHQSERHEWSYRVESVPAWGRYRVIPGASVWMVSLIRWRADTGEEDDPIAIGTNAASESEAVAWARADAISRSIPFVLWSKPLPRKQTLINAQRGRARIPPMGPDVSAAWLVAGAMACFDQCGLEPDLADYWRQEARKRVRAAMRMLAEHHVKGPAPVKMVLERPPF